MKFKLWHGRPARDSLKVSRLLIAFGIGAAVLFTAQFATAQQTVTSATLGGMVQDAGGGLISGANLTVTNLATNQKQSTTTGADGRYKFPYLSVGAYTLTIEAAGFETTKKKLTVSIGQNLDLPLTLEVSGVSAQVDVTTEVFPVETARTQVADTILPADIDQLPLNGRNYLDLALLIPGVSPTNTGSNQRFAETSAVPGQGISIAGQRNLYNSFVIDGMSANDDAADLTGSYYSEEVIDQFQVITSGGVAEFGRASAGIVNIITRSGTNAYHGNLYGFARNQRFDARNPLAPKKDLLTQAQYGATVGGPILRDRTFFFGNFEQTRRNYSTVITIAPAAIAAINSRLNSVNYRGPRLETGVVPANFDTTNFFARIDHKINQRNQLSARYSLYHISAENSRTVGGLNALSRGSGLSDTDQTFEVSNVTTLNSRTVNEARFQFTRSNLAAPINDDIGPSVTISGVANFGTATSSPLARNLSLFEAADSVSTQRGAHSPKAGVDFLYNRLNILFPGAVQGSYNFTSLNNFLSGNYTSFQQAFGIPDQSQTNPNIGFFAQDEWKVNPNFTINAGLRYDAQFLPDPIHTDTNNFAPRLGLAYAPDDHKTVLRASFGIYYDRIPLRATSNALQRDGINYSVVQLSPGQVGAPVFPNVLSQQPATLPTKPNITRIDPHIEPSYGEQASFQIEREITGGTILTVGVIHLRTLHIIVSRNVNVPTAPASAGIPNLGRPDSNWGNISRYESSGDSYYNGMIVSFNQRSRWASLRASYTLSKTIDDAGNFFFSTPQNNFDLRDDRGLSDNDQRHRLVVSGVLSPPHTSPGRGLRRLLNGSELSYIFTYASRLPFNIVLGSDRNFDTNNNDRPIAVGRNTGRGFDFASFDLRLRHRFRISERAALDAVAEGFNLFNRANLGVPNSTFGSGILPNATFGQATQAFDSRQIQFGLKLSF